MSIREKLLQFIRDEEGLTTVEYAIAGGVIAAGVIALFIAIGGKVNTKMTQIDDEMGGG